ncbi:MAG: hypothetical protein R3C01_18600, partial [Planctomycetaceae bacterium]
MLVTILTVAALLSPEPVQGAEIDDCQGLFQAGQFDDCWKQADAAITRGAYGEGWPMLKAHVELAQGKPADAVTTLQTGLERYSWSVRLRLLLRRSLRFSGNAEKVPDLDAEIEKLIDTAPWRYTDAENLVLIGQWRLEQGADAAMIQEKFFLRARQNNPSHRLPILALGQLALDKRDFALAAEHLNIAAKSFPNDPEILFSLALAVASADTETASDLQDHVLNINPNFVPLLLHLAERHFDGERYDESKQLIEQVLTIDKQQPDALALRSALQTILGNIEAAQADRKLALSTWATNPHVDFTIGRLLSRKYRFAEGATHQRLALEKHPTFLPAQKQLAEDLLRLGQDAEGWKLVDAAQQADQYDITLFNLSTLKGHVDQFRTLTRDGLIVRMDPVEA